MVAAQVKSFSNENTYSLTINERTGVAVHCTCKGCQYSKKHNCRHMKAFNEEVQRAATFILLQRRVKEIEYQAWANREMAFDSRFQ